MHQRARRKDIKIAVQLELWGKAAGRCELCNQPLWKHPLTQEPVNISQKAHIYAYSAQGPRGNKGLSKSRLNALDNLILACHACHKLIDDDKRGIKYSAGLLHRLKLQHEDRVQRNAEIGPERQSHVVYYGAPIGTTNHVFRFRDAADAMFPIRCPAEDKPIELSTINSSFDNRDDTFYANEDESLKRKFAHRIAHRISEWRLPHLSIFALAPQPLLVRLGTLVKDIVEADVYSRTREPQSWAWRRRPGGFRFISPTKAPPKIGPPVLVLSVTDRVSRKRVEDALGSRATIWEITVPDPKHDLIRAQSQLKEFRETAREVLAMIRAAHGMDETLHVFPAMPAATAVELGRARQQNVAMPWKVWDQVASRGGFVPAITISQGEQA